MPQSSPDSAEPTPAGPGEDEDPGEEPSLEDASSGPDEALRRFYDIPIGVSVVLDRKKMKFHEVLNLEVGSVIPLLRSAGENVDLLLDGKLVGDGEIVVIDEMMGLRITDIHRVRDAKES